MEPDRPGEERLFGELLASKSSRAGKSTAVAALASVVFHAAIVAGAVWATLAFGRGVIAEPEEQVTLLEIIDDVADPERPPPPVREAEPPLPQEPPPPAPEPEPVAEPEPQETGGFQTLAEPESIPDEIPASSGEALEESDFSGEGVEGGRGGGSLESETEASESTDQPSLSSYTVAPVLLNVDEVSEAMLKFYPRLLKKAGVSGVVFVWVRVDARGQFVKSAIKKSSGREAFDEAALRVTEVMRFEPASNADEPIAVWVIIPIEFRIGS